MRPDIGLPRGLEFTFMKVVSWSSHHFYLSYTYIFNQMIVIMHISGIHHLDDQMINGEKV